MDVGWDEKWQVGRDIVKTVVSRGSIRFRFHVARQTLYMTFCYVRFRCEGAQNWVAMDQVVIPDMVRCIVMLGDEVLPVFEVGKSWPVAHIREEIAIVLSRDNIPDSYDLVVEHAGQRDRKVRRLEIRISLLRIGVYYFQKESGRSFVLTIW